MLKRCSEWINYSSNLKKNYYWLEGHCKIVQSAKNNANNSIIIEQLKDHCKYLIFIDHSLK